MLRLRHHPAGHDAVQALAHLDGLIHHAVDELLHRRNIVDEAHDLAGVGDAGVEIAGVIDIASDAADRA